MRVASVEIPDNKRGEIALTYIFGIGNLYRNIWVIFKLLSS